MDLELRDKLLAVSNAYMEANLVHKLCDLAEACEDSDLKRDVLKAADALVGFGDELRDFGSVIMQR